MERWGRRFGIAFTLVIAGAALRQVTAGALAQEAAQTSRAVRTLWSELHLVAQMPADPSRASPPLAPTMLDPDADADLELGFPVKALHSAGTYRGGPVVHTLVGNIDHDPQLEILVTGLAGGPLYAWNHDGTKVPGRWPVSSGGAAAYPALGRLGRDPSQPSFPLSIISAGFGSLLDGWSPTGVPLPGWPRRVANYVTSPAALGDVDGDGLDEIFIGEEDYRLHGYRADGTPLPGWPVFVPLGSQQRRTPVIVDLDGDRHPEIITSTGSANSVSYLLAYHRDGSMVNGFPVAFRSAYPSSFPVVGDVDGDGEPEVVVAIQQPSPPFSILVRIFSNAGAVKGTLIPAQGVSYGTVPALADLDGDGFPEIIVATNGALDVWKGDGSTFPGWPRVWAPNFDVGNSAPVVGDVDGDGQPDIVVTNQYMSKDYPGEVRVYDRFGTLHPRFPKYLPLGAGAVPAIADLHRDGRNEIIVSGSYWNGHEGMYDKVWVYNLADGPCGPVLWGQFMGGPRHQGRYLGPTQ